MGLVLGVAHAETRRDTLEEAREESTPRGERLARPDPEAARDADHEYHGVLEHEQREYEGRGKDGQLRRRRRRRRRRQIDQRL